MTDVLNGRMKMERGDRERIAMRNEVKKQLLASKLLLL